MTERASIVLIYSDRPEVREKMRLAVGTRPAADVTVEFLEADSYNRAVWLLDRHDVDLLLLDGEAQPAGGLSIARQLKDERDDAPPVCVVLARSADRWLAAFAEVEATLMHPMDPVQTGQAVAALLRERASGALPSAG